MIGDSGSEYYHVCWVGNERVNTESRRTTDATEIKAKMNPFHLLNECVINELRKNLRSVYPDNFCMLPASMMVDYESEAGNYSIHLL